MRGPARFVLAALLAFGAFAPGPLTVASDALAQQRGGSARAPAKPAEKEKETPAPGRAAARALRSGSAAAVRDRRGARLPAQSLRRARCRRMAEPHEGDPRHRGRHAGAARRLAGAYNRGFRGYSLTYRICTPAAGEAARRYLAEGERLSHAIAGRFGG